MKKEIMMMAALASGAGFIAQAQDHNQFNFGDWAKNSFTLFNAERDGAPNPHALKVMFGAEYINSHGTDAAGNKGFTGWQLSTGVRWDF